MNTPSVLTVIVGVVLAAGVLIFGQSDTRVVPRPDDNVVVPDVPDVELQGIALLAKEGADDYPLRSAANLREAKRRLETGEFKTPNEVRSWLAEEIAKSRRAAFQAWHESLDKAIAAEQLPQALGESAAGFEAAAGKR